MPRDSWVRIRAATGTSQGTGHGHGGNSRKAAKWRQTGARMVDEIHEDEKLFGYGEGFYGPPHAWEDREHLVDFLGRHGLNAYIYAPKNDPYHRDKWRSPYPDEELDHFRSIVRRANDQGVNFVYAIAPLGVKLSDPDELDAVKAKLRPFIEMGMPYLAILFDDVPEHLAPEDAAAFTNLGEGHRVFTEKVYEWLEPQGVRLAFCPVEYTGTHMSPYLEELAKLPPEIPAAWTGRAVVCDEISGEEVRDRAESLGRPIIVWDNFPVNDGPMAPWLHVGPYAGRSADAVFTSGGIFLNGMWLARASTVGLAQLGDLVSNPAGFETITSWRAACAEVGVGAPDAFVTFAEQCADSTLYTQPSPTLAALIDRAEAASTRTEIADSRVALTEELARETAAVSSLRADLADRRLFDEIAPWLDQMAANVTAMTAAVGGWTACAPEVNQGRFEMEQAFGIMAGVMSRRRAAMGEKNVHGATFGFRAVLETVDGGWRLLPGALVTNQSQVDRLFRLVFSKLTRPRS